MKNRITLFVCCTLLMLSGGILACESDTEREQSLSELMRERTNQLRAVQQAFEQQTELSDDVNLAEYTHFAGARVSRPALGEPGVQGQLKAFETFYARFVNNPDPETYNIVIKTCLSCHERMCPGPLRLIRSLSLEEMPEPGFTLY